MRGWAFPSGHVRGNLGSAAAAILHPREAGRRRQCVPTWCPRSSEIRQERPGARTETAWAQFAGLRGGPTQSARQGSARIPQGEIQIPPSPQLLARFDVVLRRSRAVRFLAIRFVATHSSAPPSKSRRRSLTRERALFGSRHRFSRLERLAALAVRRRVGAMSDVAPRAVWISLNVVTWFNLVSAVVGAVGLIGFGGMGLPLEWLDESPFATYFWPGVILGVVGGGFSRAGSSRHPRSLSTGERRERCGRSCDDDVGLRGGRDDARVVTAAGRLLRCRPRSGLARDTHARSVALPAPSARRELALHRRQSDARRHSRRPPHVAGPQRR